MHWDRSLLDVAYRGLNLPDQQKQYMYNVQNIVHFKSCCYIWIIWDWMETSLSNASDIFVSINYLASVHFTVCVTVMKRLSNVIQWSFSNVIIMVIISPQNQKEVLVGIEKPCRSQALLATNSIFLKIILKSFFVLCSILLHCKQVVYVSSPPFVLCPTKYHTALKHGCSQQKHKCL